LQLFVLLLFITSQGVRVLCDTWLSVWSAQDLWADRSRNFWIAVYFILVGITFFLSLVRSFMFSHGVALRSSRRIHATVFGLIMRASVPLFFDVTPLGRILNLMSKDLDHLDSLLPTTLFVLVQNVFILIGVIAVCVTGSPYMVLLFLPIAGLFMMVQRFFRKSQRELKRIENTSRSPVRL